MRTSTSGFLEVVRPPFLDQVPSPQTAKQSFLFYRSVLQKYYPQAIPSKWHELMQRFLRDPPTSFLEYNRAVLLLQSALDDSHAHTNKHMNYRFTGGFILDENTVVIDSANPSVPVGSVLLEKDGVSVDTILKQKQKYSKGSYGNIKKFYATLFLEKSKRRDVKLKLLCEGETREVDVVYEYYFPAYKGPFLEVKDDHVVIHPASPTYESILKHGKKTIVFDMRQYPSDYEKMMNTVTSLNNSGKPLHYANYYTAIEDGTHVKTPLYLAASKQAKAKYNIVVLVSARSLSMSEFFIMALQSLKTIGHRVVTRGTQTGGANGDVTEIPMLYDIFCTINLNYVTYPDDTPMQRVGVRI